MNAAWDGVTIWGSGDITITITTITTQFIQILYKEGGGKKLVLMPEFMCAHVQTVNLHNLLFVRVTSVGVSRGYTDYHQGRAIHMADSRIH